MEQGMCRGIPTKSLREEQRRVARVWQGWRSGISGVCGFGRDGEELLFNIIRIVGRLRSWGDRGAVP